MKNKKRRRRVAKDDFLRSLVENALEFLNHAIDEFESEPKFSIIHFYAALELFLKARLLSEHWTLVVLKDPDRDRFIAGDFVSVTFEGACTRLAKVIKSQISDRARIKFDAVRKHRNKMLHFFHEADGASKSLLEAVAIEQLGAWYELQQLLTVEWAAIFEEWSEAFQEIERRLKRQRDYLAAKFDAIKPEIAKLKKQKVPIETCNSCHFAAAQIIPEIGDLKDAICLVCDHRERWLDFVCPKCDEISRLGDGGEFKCPECSLKLDEAGLVDELDETIVTKHNYFDIETPANCGECEGYHTVLPYKEKYLCIRCFDVSEHLNQCEWCGEANTGNMSDSGWAGCTMCDGRAGNLGDD